MATIVKSRLMTLAWIFLAGTPLLLGQDLRPSPPKLVGATIVFDTLDNDKDPDTVLDITLRDHDKRVVAARFGQGGHWQNHSTTHVVLDLDDSVDQSALTDSSLEIDLHRNGNDGWSFQGKLILTFSDRTTCTKVIPATRTSPDSNKIEYSLGAIAPGTADSTSLTSPSQPDTSTTLFSSLSQPKKATAGVTPPAIQIIEAATASKAYATVTVFYVTDRLRTSDGNYGPEYGSDPIENNNLNFGTAQISIPHDHRQGDIERPSVMRLQWSEDPNQHVKVLRKVPDPSAGSFYSGVASALQGSPKKEVLVFIHGFNTSFDDALMRTAQIEYDLNFAGAPILYSWPSGGELGVLAYKKDERNADLSAYHLRTFLEDVRARTGAEIVDVVAHSMGNRVLALALGGLAGEKRARPVPPFHHIALMAPDIDAEQFRRLSVAMKSTASHVTLYCSSKDDALLAAQHYSGYPRAGQPLVLVDGIDTIDASAVDTSPLGAFHAYFADNQTIISDLFYLIRDHSPGDRVRLRKQTSGGKEYWRFEPAAR